MSYFKIFGFSALSSLLLLSLFIMVSFDSDNNLKEAYEHFSKANYYESRESLLNEVDEVLPADFYLYEAYLAREELGLKKAQDYLFQGYEKLQLNKSTTALEITLNIALNAFLQKDKDVLTWAIDESYKLAQAEEILWIYHFEALLAYQQKDYKKAALHFENSQNKKWLSNWMKTGFSNHLSENDLQTKILHARIYTEDFLTIRSQLLNLLENKDLKNIQEIENIHFLIALSYIQEANLLPSYFQELTYQACYDHLKNVSQNNSFWQCEKDFLLDLFAKKALESLSEQKHSFYLQALHDWQAEKELKAISQNLLTLAQTPCDFNEEVYAESLLKYALNTDLKTYLLEEISETLSYAIQNHEMMKQFNWDTYLFLFDENTYLYQPINQELKARLVQLCFEQKELNEEFFAPLNLWLKLEKTDFKKTAFAIELIEAAQKIWFSENTPSKACQLIQIALNLQAKEALKEVAKEALLNIYRQSMLQDDIEHYPYILQAAISFKLDPYEIFDPKESACLLADAEYLFLNGQYQKALKKAHFVLKLEPGNEQAKGILSALYQE